MSIRTSLSARHVRMLLVKAGLNDVEADAFMDRIEKEIIDGRLTVEEERQKFIEHELHSIIAKLDKTPQRSEAIITAIVAGVASIPIYDTLKEFAPKVVALATQINIPEEAERIQSEWAGVSLPREAFQLETLQRIRQWRQDTYGTRDKRLAVYLDAIGMALDYRDAHREAEQFRHHAIVISRAIHGTTDSSVAACYCNAGLTLFHRRKFRKSTEYLMRSLRISLGTVGIQHHNTLAAVYNIWYCANAQGLLHNTKMPPEFMGALPEIKQYGTTMMARKVMLVLLLGLTDILRQLVQEQR